MVEKPFSSQRGGEDYRVQGHNTRAEIQGVFKVIVHCMFEPPTSCVQSKKSASQDGMDGKFLHRTKSQEWYVLNDTTYVT